MSQLFGKGVLGCFGWWKDWTEENFWMLSTEFLDFWRLAASSQQGQVMVMDMIRQDASNMSVVRPVPPTGWEVYSLRQQNSWRFGFEVWKLPFFCPWFHGVFLAKGVSGLHGFGERLRLCGGLSPQIIRIIGNDVENGGKLVWTVW